MEKNLAKRTIMKSLALELLDILDREDGSPFADKKAAMLDAIQQKEDEQVTELSVKAAYDEAAGRKIQDAFWQFGDTITASSEIRLLEVCEKDREKYLDIQREYSFTKSMLKYEAYRDMVWSEFTAANTLMFSIYINDNYTGYCGIKDTGLDPWEIAIELLPEWTNKGIGTVAIPAMLKEIKNRSGVSYFRVRIDSFNYISQHLFEKLGAVPKGISVLLLHDEKLQKECEEDNLHLIDDKLSAVAEKFGVEPRKLLSHVLEYTLLWN